MCDKEHTLAARSAPEAGKAVDAMKFAKQAIEAAEEELRLIREKDSAAVYSPMLRPVTLPLAIQKLSAALASSLAPTGAQPVATPIPLKNGGGA